MSRLKAVIRMSMLQSVRGFLLTAVFSLTVIASPSDQPWGGAAFSADSAVMVRAAESVPVPEGDEVIVLFEEGKFVFESDGRSSYTHRLVYRFVTTNAVQEWTTVEVMWLPWHEQRPSIRARVITADGVEHPLDSNTIAESPASQGEFNIFGDTRVLRAPLPAIAPGAVVEMETVVAETAPVFDQGVVKWFLLGKTVRVLETRLIIESPDSLPLQHVVRLLPSIESRHREADGRVELTFESGPLDAIKDLHSLVPSDVPQWPYVAFSVGRSWGEVAAGYGQIVESRIDEAAVEDMTRETISAAETREEVIAGLLARVRQDVRYTGVEFGRAAIVPRTPTQTLTRGYGDCKDQATLLIAMLRSAGIDAHLALLNAGTGLDVEKGLPGFGTFNHAIVYVPGTSPLWIDPTNEFARVGQLPVVDQGRLALIADESTTDLIRTPEATSFENHSVETREVYLAEQGSGRVIETTEAWGSIERYYRRNYSQLNQTEIQDIVRTYAKDTYAAESVSNIEHTAAHDLSRPFRLRFEAANTQATQTDSNGAAAVAIFTASLIQRLPQISDLFGEESSLTGTPAKNRTADLVLPEPFVSEWRYRIVSPPGFRSGPLPEGEKTNSAWLRFRRNLLRPKMVS